MSLNSVNQRVIHIAENWVGTPYRHQMSIRNVGCDCLGLLLGIWRDLGGPPVEFNPNYSRDWAECAPGDRLLEAANKHLVSVSGKIPQVGDVLLFRWSSFSVSKHIAILAEDSRIIHAYERHAVCKTTLVPQWRRRISGVFRFPDGFSQE